MLGNAACFFGNSGYDYLAGKLLHACSQLDPANPEWPESLASLHSLDARKTAKHGRQNWMTAMALTEWQTPGLSRDAGEGWAYLSETLVSLAFQWGTPRKHAATPRLLSRGRVLQETPWARGSAIHQVIPFFGLIAPLKGTSIEKERLVAAVTGSRTPRGVCFSGRVWRAWPWRRTYTGQGGARVIVDSLQKCERFFPRIATLFPLGPLRSSGRHTLIRSKPLL